MKFICHRDTILKELSNASDFTAQRTTATMLATVCLTLSENTLSIKSTDQKMGYVSQIDVQSLEDGSVAVVCDKFLDIIKTLPAKDICFEVRNETILIKPEGSSIEFKLRTQDAQAFPEIVIPEDDSFFRISQKDLTDMINQVSFAVSDDESKFAMNGALLERGDNSLIMVGTDGRRLSYINRAVETEIPEFNNVTIPSKFLSIIRKHSVNEGDFEVSVNSQSIYLKTSDCVIFSNLIKNEFPAYRRVIPEKQTSFCVVSVKALEEALKRVSLLVESKYKKVILEFSENTLTIRTEETELGAGREVLECEYEGEDQRCAMNYTYLLNPLKVMSTEKVRIMFTESSRPFTVTSEPQSDYLHVIMPMNLSN